MAEGAAADGVGFDGTVGVAGAGGAAIGLPPGSFRCDGDAGHQDGAAECGDSDPAHHL